MFISILCNFLKICQNPTQSNEQEVFNHKEFILRQVMDLKNLKTKDQIEENYSLKLLKVPEQIQRFLKEKIQSVDFDPFELFAQKQGNELGYLLQELLYVRTQTGQNLKIKADDIVQLGRVIQQNYLNSPYHNEIHSFDVTATSFLLAEQSKFFQKAKVPDHLIYSFIISAAAHDMGHPGFMNVYLINTGSNLAQIYNDQSVLENYHVHLLFKILNENFKGKLTCSLTYQQYEEFRKWSIKLILGTDNAQHFSNLAQLKNSISKQDFDVQNESLMVAHNILHAADISTPIKGKFSVCKQWAERVLEEFFNQGDLEQKQNMAITYMCDRKTVQLPQSQIGFANYLVLPLYKELGILFPELQYLEEIIQRNNKNWEDLKALEEKK